jgi:hypothetical protein
VALAERAELRNGKAPLAFRNLEQLRRAGWWPKLERVVIALLTARKLGVVLNPVAPRGTVLA